MRTTRRVALTVLAVVLAIVATMPGAVAAPPPLSGRGLVESTLRRMTVEEKVGQLFWTRAYGASAHDRSFAAQNQSTYGVDTAAEVVDKYHLGGVLYFAWAGNTSSPQQMVQLSNGLQEVATSGGAGIPLSLSIDQEGGIVQRMLEPATVFPGNMALGATRSAELAGEQFAVFGEELRAVGVNTDFAPVVDVNTNPANPVIGVRSFGESPELVGDLGAAATRGLQAHDVAATLKHFPGHGDTSVDSHYGLPIVTYDRQTLEDVHVAPFQQAIDTAQPDAIMTAHIIVEAIDPENPATLSPKVLTGLLREDMGYEGLIVTDSLGMAGVRQKYGDDRVPVLAVKAGADVVLNPPEMDVAYNAVVDAVRNGEITTKRLDESVRRVLEMKLRRGLFADPYADPAAVPDHVGTSEHLALADEIAQRAATVVRNDDLLPLTAGSGQVAVVGPSLGDPGTLAAELAARGRDTETVVTGTQPSDAQIAAAAAAADGKDLALVVTYSAWRYTRQQDLVEAVVDTGTPVLVVGSRDPYDVAWLPEVDAFLATYGNRAVSLRAAAAVAFDEVAPAGALPVTIPRADGDGVLYPYGHGLGYDG